MKTRLSFMLIFISISWQIVAQDSGTDKIPFMEFEQATHDFGDIDKGEKVTHVFKFKNTGNAPLEIQNVATSCGCTSAKPEKTLYEPGESGEIPVTFNSERFSGKITKRITITTNDTRNPKTIVTINGNIVVDIISKPVSVFFTKAKSGQKTTQEIMVSTEKLPKLEISKIETNPEFLSAELVPVDDKNAKIILTADGTKFPEGKSRLNGAITYETNSETQKTIRTTVTINIDRPLKASPNSVYFFATKQGKERETTLKLSSSEGQEFKIQEIKADLDYISVKEDKGEGAVKSLTVVLSDQTPVGKFNGTITVKTNIAAQPQLVIPIRGSVIN